MPSGFENELSRGLTGGMQPIMIDDKIAADPQPASVIGRKVERVDPVGRNVQEAGESQSEAIVPPSWVESKRRCDPPFRRASASRNRAGVANGLRTMNKPAPAGRRALLSAPAG